MWKTINGKKVNIGANNHKSSGKDKRFEVKKKPQLSNFDAERIFNTLSENMRYDLTKEAGLHGFAPDTTFEYSNLTRDEKTKIRPVILKHFDPNDYYTNNHPNNYGDRHISCKTCGYHFDTWGGTLAQHKNSKQGKDHMKYHNLALKNR